MDNSHPGPIDNSILYDQDKHISERVWQGKEAGPLRCIPTPNHESWEINDRMWELVWAYSRMTIGRPIRRTTDWDTNVEFPLLLTWHNRLRSHHFQTRVEDARRRLDIMEVDDFNWLPYRDFENIQEYIDDADVPLFRSNTALISFWIVERHCPDRVMKQFGLHQVIPPIFQRPFPRDEMVPIGDNKREKIRAIYSGVWNKRMDAITYEEEGDAGPHTDEYFQWYRRITRLWIGRQTDVTGLNLTTVQSNILKYSEKILSSCRDAAQSQEKSPTDFENFIEAVRADVLMLKDSCLTDASPSNKDHGVHVVSQETSQQSGKGAPATSPAGSGPKKRKTASVATQLPSTPSLSISTMVPKPPKRSKRIIEKLAKQIDASMSTRTLPADISESSSIPIALSPRRSPRLFHTYDSPKSPIKVVGHGSTAKSPSKSPFTSIPWSVPESFSSAQPMHPKFGISVSPFSEISSMILNVKARFRDPKPPLWMADYSTGAWMRNPKYKLTTEEHDILTVFRNEYADREGNAKLQEFCTPVTADIMSNLLKGAWMDNWTMHSWFQILKQQAASSYFFECALSDWFVHAEHYEKHVQNSFGLAMMDNIADKEFLFFPVWNNHHFFLLVGRVNELRWDYYNSSNREGDYLFAERYIAWINDRFMQFGWSDPTVWSIHRMDCPMQTNSVDCGIFVMAYAKHIALSLLMNFSKSDMYYFRAKIVYDLYIDQYARWK